MTKEELLRTMMKQGYIVKVKDMITGEPRYDYHLGPRGKVEVGKQGTIDFIAKVFECLRILMKGLWR
jgi:melanoma-associated antigen